MVKGPFMEFLRGNVVQAAINTYAELQVPTPASKTENMAMLIHSIEIHPSRLVDTTPTNGDFMEVHVAKASKAASAFIHDPDILATYKVETVINAGVGEIQETGQQVYKFNPPILYPKTNLYIAISSVGLAATAGGKVRIGYTLEKVSREDFISALVE